MQRTHSDNPFSIPSPTLSSHTERTKTYINRELSLLDFQARVLALAENPELPLLERIKFVAVVSQNIDEFFQVRVAGLLNKAATSNNISPDGMTAAEQLVAIRLKLKSLGKQIDQLYMKELIPALANAGIKIRNWEEIDRKDLEYLDQIFEKQIFPVLTPLAVDPSHPFPYISNLSLNLAVVLQSEGVHQINFARVKVPPILPRFVK